MKRSLLIVALATGTAAAAGLYDQPYSLVEPAQSSATREEKPPAITQIDGKSTRSTRRPDPITPGKHTIRIRYETGRFQQSEDEIQRDLVMDLEPCTRYIIAAKRTEGTQWVPEIYSEKIGECTKKFGKK